MPLTPEKIAAIEAVIVQIDAYRGEPIIRGVHPLWLAVVALEHLSRERYTVTPSGQTHRLDFPASTSWYRLVWASRGTRLTEPRTDAKEASEKGPFWFSGRGFVEVVGTEPRPDLALKWSKILRDCLAHFLSSP